MCIHCPQKHGMAQDRESAIHLSATDPNIARRRAPEQPQRTAGAQIESCGIAGWLGNINDAISYQGSRFELIEIVGLIHPREFQSTRVGTIDLAKTRIAMSGVSSRVSQPVMRRIRCM